MTNNNQYKYMTTTDYVGSLFVNSWSSWSTDTMQCTGFCPALVLWLTDSKPASRSRPPSTSTYESAQINSSLSNQCRLFSQFPARLTRRRIIMKVAPLLLSLLLASVQAHEYFPGQCPNFTPMAGFEWNKVGKRNWGKNCTSVLLFSSLRVSGLWRESFPPNHLVWPTSSKLTQRVSSRWSRSASFLSLRESAWTTSTCKWWSWRWSPHLTSLYADIPASSTPLKSPPQPKWSWGFLWVSSSFSTDLSLN